MIQINCTTDNVASPAILNCSNGSVITAEVESSTRSIFRLNDSDANTIGEFVDSNGNILFSDYHVPGLAGAYEGPLLIGVSNIPILHISRDQWLDEKNRNYNWHGHIDFMLYRRSLDGVNIEPLLQQRKEAGSNAVVTLMMAHYIEHFDPSTYGTEYFNHIEPFAEALRNAGFLWTPIVFADAQVIMPDKNQQIQFLNNISNNFRSCDNIYPSLCNEYQKNGCDPSIFSKPLGNLWSRGSSTSDAEPYRPGWDWKEWHPRRDWPKVLFGNDDAWYVKEGINADGQHLDYPMPCISSEPIGFWYQNVPGRRSNDPNLARVVGGTSIYFPRGANFMSEQGLRCEMWDDITYSCAVEFFKAINQ